MTDKREWVLVPRVPTPEMVQASDDISCRAEGAEHWAAMLAAAPQPPSGGEVFDLARARTLADYVVGYARSAELKPLSSDACVALRDLHALLHTAPPNAPVGVEVVAQFYVSDKMEELCPIAGMEPGRIRALLGNGTHDLVARTAPLSAPVGVEAIKSAIAELDALRNAMFKTYAAAANGADKAKLLRLIEAERDAYEAHYSLPKLQEALAQQPAAVDGVADFEIHAGGEYFASVGGPRERAWKEAMHYVSTLHPDDGEPEVFEVTRRKVALAAQQGGVK